MAAAVTSPIPGAFGGGGYADAALTAKTAYQNALAQINQNRTSALQQYGYLGDINPQTGTLTNMRVDPNNPYGSFQTMLSNHASASSAAEANALQRGLGHGGLAAQGLTADKKSFGADSAQLGQSLMASLEGFQQAQNSAQQTMNDTLYQSELDAARNAILQQLFTPADFSGITDPGYGYGDGTDGSGGSSASGKTSSVFQKALMARGFSANQAANIDPAIGAAILHSKPASKKPSARGGVRTVNV